jgi:aminoglycoside 2''-phosphotransferase
VNRDEHRSAVQALFGRGARSFEPIGEGWACDTYLADGEWVFQFPRLPGEEEALRRQIAVLPALAARVSGCVPVPAYVSIEAPCMGYRMIDGAPFDEVSDDGVWPERLGRFLAHVHATSPASVGLRPRSVESIRAAVRADIDGWSSDVLPLLDAGERRAAVAMFAAYLDDDSMWQFAPRLTHGDIGPEHILVTPDGDLAGVIDWGDLGIGDPAGDLAPLLEGWASIGERVLAAYGGEPDPRFRDRARFGFAFMPWNEVVHGHSTGQPAFVDSGLAGVRARLL